MLPPFPVDDFALAAVEHGLDACLNEDNENIGSEFSLHEVLDFYSGYDPSQEVVLEAEADTPFGRLTISEYVGGPIYHHNDVIRALIAEVRRLRPSTEGTEKP